MKFDIKKTYIFEIILLIILFLAISVPKVFNRTLIAITLGIMALILNLFIKKKGTKSIYLKQVSILIIIFSLIYLGTFYLLGLYFGFNQNVFTFSFKTIYKFIIPITLIIVFSELIRHRLLFQDAKIIIKSKKIDLSGILLFISMTIIDILLYTTLYSSLRTYDDYLTLIGLIIFSSLSCNLLYNYISKRYGEKPVIIFRLFTNLYAFIIPIIPDVYIFFRSFVRMIYPYFIYIFLENTYAKTSTIISYHDKRKRVISTTIMVIVLTLFIMLVSCKFKYGILVVGSESMTGSINKGDAVVFERYDKQTIIHEGDVIIFISNDDVRTVHRVVDIKNINNEYRYYTKGDANELVDNGYITSKQIEGVSKFKILYIGYPTVLVRELFDK